MLHSLSLRNFKRFGPRSEPIPLAPVTLLFGRNSAGKSTILQALSVLRRTFTSPYGPYHFVTESPTYSLGTFKNVIFRHLIDQQLEMGLSLGKRGEVSCSATFTTGDEQGTMGVLSMLRLRTADAGGLDLVPAAKHDEHEAARSFGVEQRYPIPLPDFVLGARVMIGPDFRRVDVPLVEDTETNSDDRVRQQNIDREVVELQIKELLDRFLFGALLRQILGIRHIGRVRETCPRLIDTHGDELLSRSVGIRGDRMGRLLAKDSVLLAKANEALEELGLPYLLHLKKLPTTSSLWELLLEHRGEHLEENLAKVGVSDVGSGISQLLPILTAFEGAVLDMQEPGKGSISLLIEQPELHLHPALQADLLEYLAGFVGDKPRVDRCPQVLIETHSEHMVLRVQSLIREQRLRREDVCVLVLDVDAEDDSAFATRIEFSERGRMLTPWPGGFFTEREGEILL